MIYRHLLSQLAMVAVLATGFAACEMAPTAPTGDPGTLGLPGAYGAEIAYCADEINRYRALVGQPALRRSGALEAFAATAAQTDGTAHIAHHHFRTTNGDGIAMAETEILWWRDSAVRSVVQRGLAQMWDVGPGGEHYAVIVGRYTEVGCGVFVNGAEVTVAQDFR